MLNENLKRELDEFASKTSNVPEGLEDELWELFRETLAEAAEILIEINSLREDEDPIGIIEVDIGGFYDEN